jgi:hypothetical protein
MPCERAAGAEIDDRGGLVPEPDDAAVPGDHPVLGPEHSRASGARPLLVERPVEIFRMGALDPQLGIGPPFLGGVAEERLGLWADVDVAEPGRTGGVGHLRIRDCRDLLDQPPVGQLRLVGDLRHVFIHATPPSAPGVWGQVSSMTRSESVSRSILTGQRVFF